MISTEARVFAAAINRLVAARDAHGLSQRAIAKQLGCQHSTISQWRNGLRLPGATHLSDLLDVLKVSEHERGRMLRLYDAVLDAKPDYTSAARAVLTSANLPARQVELVLNALAAHCATQPGLCATGVDADDLRRMAAELGTSATRVDKL